MRSPGRELTLIAVGTPSTDGDHRSRADVARRRAHIGAALPSKPGYHVVVVKSTVVPGTTDEVVRAELEAASGKRAGVDFGLGDEPGVPARRVGRRRLHGARPASWSAAIDERSIESLERLYAMFDEHAGPRARPRAPPR